MGLWLLVMAGGGGQGGGGQGSGLGQMLFLLISFILIFYFLILRPQQKRQREHQQMLNSLKKGDRVLTTGGLYGTIVGLKDKEDIAVLKIAENVKVEVAKTSIQAVIRE
jgi:preprotein translocase subunit YajC